MTTTPTSIDNKTTKVKRLREDKFCVLFGFLLWWVLFYTLVKRRKFFISKNLVIIFKLSIIESFYYTQKDFATILVFFGSYHSPRKIAKE
jgi:hypothetical protein